MTLQDVQTIRDNLKTAIFNLSLIMLDHTIGDASYSHDQHRKQLMDELRYWDKVYVAKTWAGIKKRQDQKSV